MWLLTKTLNNECYLYYWASGRPSGNLPEPSGMRGFGYGLTQVTYGPNLRCKWTASRRHFKTDKLNCKSSLVSWLDIRQSCQEGRDRAAILHTSRLALIMSLEWREQDDSIPYIYFFPIDTEQLWGRCMQQKRKTSKWKMNRKLPQAMNRLSASGNLPVSFR